MFKTTVDRAVKTINNEDKLLKAYNESERKQSLLQHCLKKYKDSARSFARNTEPFFYGQQGGSMEDLLNYVQVFQVNLQAIETSSEQRSLNTSQAHSQFK